MKNIAQLRITARMYIGTPSGCLGLRGAAARRSATWPFALVGLRATSHTCDSLCAIAHNCIVACHNTDICYDHSVEHCTGMRHRYCTFVRDVRSIAHSDRQFDRLLFDKLSVLIVFD